MQIFSKALVAEVFSSGTKLFMKILFEELRIFKGFYSLYLYKALYKVFISNKIPFAYKLTRALK
jgi:hypothetical protein